MPTRKPRSARSLPTCRDTSASCTTPPAGASVTPHVVAGFAVGFGLGLYGEVADGLLFAVLMVALLIALQVLCLVWPLAFPRSGA